MLRVSLFLLLTSTLLPAQVNFKASADEVAALYAKHDYAAIYKRLPAALHTRMTEEAFVNQVASLEKQIGKFEKYDGEPREVSAGAIRQFIYPTQFANAKLGLYIAYNDKGELAGFTVRQMPPESSAFNVVTGKYKLPAELKLPQGAGPFPLVVLVHGSGPNDRDETIGPNKVFKDIAEGLAARGVATLRYEKRTRQYPESAGPEMGIDEETADDAVSAAALARQQPKIDKTRIFIAGHSQGAWAAPRIATKDAAVAGIILLAGNARPLEELVREQIKYLGEKPEAADQLLGRMTPQFREDIKSYDPVATAQEVTTPMLILQGERDYQVTMADFALWTKAFGKSNRAQLKSYPKLNHLFLEGEGKSMPAEYMKPGHVAPYVLDDISKWVLAQKPASAK